jgi:hypothetical protein
MRRIVFNFLIDFVSFVGVLGMITTGLVVRYILPAGSGGFRHRVDRTLWSLSRHQWGELHFWVAAVLGALLVVHVALHWSWICHFVRQWIHGREHARSPIKPWVRHLYGIGFLLLVAGCIAAFMLIARYNVVRY